MGTDHDQRGADRERADRRSPWPRAVGLLGALAVALVLALGVARERFLSYDAFISFRYAEHLASGLGLVWNAGERVEGYTNFLWVLLVAAGMELGIEPGRLANALGIASGGALLVALFRFAARRRSARGPWPWLLVLALALNGSFAAWCTGGLETMFFALLAFLGTATLIDAGGAPRGALLSALCFALATLTRPEGALFAALAGLFLAVDVAARRRPLAVLLAWLAPFVAIVGAHVLWRRTYYGEWLPNTFHAKVPGLWLEQGRRYFAYFHDSYRAGWFVPFAALALLGPQHGVARRFALVCAAYGAYVLAIGGDLFEFRFLIPVLPFFAWLVVEGLATLAELSSSLARSPIPSPHPPGDAPGGRPATAPVALEAGGSADRPRPSARTGPARLLAALGALLFLWTNARGYERVPGTSYGVMSVPGIRQYTERRIDEGRFLRARIDARVLPAELVLGLGGAGAVPYYTRWTTVDRRGLNDAHIARLPVEERGFIAHERDAPFDYLVERRVAVFDVFNRLLVSREELLAGKARYEHDGRPLAMRAIRLDDRYLVFASFVGDEELARLLPGLEILSPETIASERDGSGDDPRDG